jgi:hypothetical protein|tara:strand:+ start:1068 stop:1193 length:126 start_codon:yes stop_codon:yes gene_type:complete
MAKSIGIVASATHRLALDTLEKLDKLIKTARFDKVANQFLS